jgi:hypothetical protein
VTRSPHGALSTLRRRPAGFVALVGCSVPVCWPGSLTMTRPGSSRTRSDWAAGARALVVPDLPLTRRVVSRAATLHRRASASTTPTTPPWRCHRWSELRPGRGSAPLGRGRVVGGRRCATLDRRLRGRNVRVGGPTSMTDCATPFVLCADGGQCRPRSGARAAFKRVRATRQRVASLVWSCLREGSRARAAQPAGPAPVGRAVPRTRAQGLNRDVRRSPRRSGVRETPFRCGSTLYRPPGRPQDDYRGADLAGAVAERGRRIAGRQ